MTPETSKGIGESFRDAAAIINAYANDHRSELAVMLARMTHEELTGAVIAILTSYDLAEQRQAEDEPNT